MDVTPGAFTVEAAAAYTSMSEREIRRLIKAGYLTPRAKGEKGGAQIILRADLDSFLAALPVYETKPQAS